jgi:hypothetical protein
VPRTPKKRKALPEVLDWRELARLLEATDATTLGEAIPRPARARTG